MDAEEKKRLFERAEELLVQQNFFAAVVVGSIAVFFAAAAYGIITSRAGFASGFVAAAVGIVIGASMQSVGRGIETRFAVAATVLTLVGWALGNLVRAIVVLGPRDELIPLSVFQSYSLAELVRHAASYFSIGDLIFWFIAVFAAVFLARRSLARSDRLALGLYELER